MISARSSVLLLILFPIVLLSGCTSAPETGEPRTFERADLLQEHLNTLFDTGNYREAVDRLTFALERNMFPREQLREIMDEILTLEQLRYNFSQTTEDWPELLRARDNLVVLRDDPLQLLPMDLVHEPLLERDEILLSWARAELDRGEDVLALYLLLRRSTLQDIPEEERIPFREVAQRFNNREAYLRLGGTTAAEAMRKQPADLLGGTVTVWVNRGVRISQGVGVPDRVVGSGFFVDPRGYIITNHHVIESEVNPEYNGYSRLYIRMPGRPNERVPARVVGYDRIFDIALIKAELDAPVVMSLSDIRRMVPGERVLALGSPGGLDSTITSGIVSASGRRFLQMGEAVQIDAPVNPGNSGGPLVFPDDGQVAAVVFAGIAQFEGVNFVIPAYWIRHFFPRLFSGGEVVHPWIGASFHEGRRGLEATYVVPGSPAHRAGVQAGDILSSIGGEEVTTMIVAQDILMGASPGRIVTTTWRSIDGAERRRMMTLAERPFSPVDELLKSKPIETLFPVLFGMEVDELSGSWFGRDFVITRVLPGSIADESSLSENDPFSMRNWHVDRDLRAAFVQIVIRKRKEGFLESGLQLGAFLETNTFL